MSDSLALAYTTVARGLVIKTLSAAGAAYVAGGITITEVTGLWTALPMLVRIRLGLAAALILELDLDAREARAWFWDNFHKKSPAAQLHRAQSINIERTSMQLLSAAKEGKSTSNIGGGGPV